MTPSAKLLNAAIMHDPCQVPAESCLSLNPEDLHAPTMLRGLAARSEGIDTIGTWAESHLQFMDQKRISLPRWTVSGKQTPSVFANNLERVGMVQAHL